MSTLDVLLIEDDEDVGALLVHHLQTLGHHVRHVRTGEAGLDCARASPPTLAVVDIRLPGIDGREVVRRLRADERTAHCPIVVTTIVDVDDLGDVAADAVLRKPFRRGDIAAALAGAGSDEPNRRGTHSGTRRETRGGGERHDDGSGGR